MGRPAICFWIDPIHRGRVSPSRSRRAIDRCAWGRPATPRHGRVSSVDALECVWCIVAAAVSGCGSRIRGVDDSRSGFAPVVLRRSWPEVFDHLAGAGPEHRHRGEGADPTGLTSM
jgi:hypothetical protein